ncbi:MAG TPA: TetR/AcrR family transcriptional regulator [Lacunisphaera sp.]|jgi:AcrR family transcriptional regulator
MAYTLTQTTASTPKRDLLLDTAADLFYRDGYHAVGIDKILAEAGLAKMTLYHHFASKDELIVAVLERRGRAIGAEIAAAIEAAGSSPRRRLLAFFDWHEHWFDRKDFNGCAFIRAIGEYPDVKSPIHQAVTKQKQAARDRLETMLVAMEVPDPKAMAIQLHLLLEGAIVSAHTFGDPKIIKSVREAAFALIKSASK